ncbi:MAG: hypothetical protein QGG40_20685 [Myxococcota bacterium]|jgi:hypothetical protein|nr:hypothetical protein [Myxococcota bacterium]
MVTRFAHIPRRSLAVLVTLPACGGGTLVTGSVGGTDLPKMQSALFVEATDLYDDSGLVQLYVTDVDDACSTFTAYQEDISQAQGADDFATVWSSHFPDRFWRINIVMRIADPSVSNGGETLTGVSWDESLQGPGEAYGHLFAYTDTLDEAYWNHDADDADYVTTYRTDGGSLTIDRHTPSQRLSGSFETSTVDSEGSGQGELDIQFDASHCAELEELGS